MAKLLGPLSVAFGDLQAAKESFVQPPLLRFYYPCKFNGGSCWQKSSWLPSPAYAYGYVSNVSRPNTAIRKAFTWFLSYVLYAILLPVASISAAVSKPILTEEDENKNERFPVVIFSHGLWACRATYSAFCSDLASYGYIVIAPEHLDGSATMACFIDNDGTKQWVQHRYPKSPGSREIPLEERGNQLRQRAKEIETVLNVVEGLNNGVIKSNLWSGRTKLDINMFRNRIDFDRVAIAGHSFGGATSIIAAGIFDRIQCCLGLDVWWEPIEEIHYEKVSGKVPVLLLNTEKFDWSSLREARLIYLNARAAAHKDGEPLETKLVTIKDTRHQDQSDFPLFLPGISKRLKLSGDLDVQLAKDINSRVCIQFLQNHLPRSGGKYPIYFHPVESDTKYLVSSDI